jgi:hypothetical protein
MKLKPRLAARRTTVILLGAVLTGAFLSACSKHEGDNGGSDQAQTDKPPATVSIENGHTVLTLDPATQERLGIEIATLTSTVTRQQMTVPALTLSAEDLATARNSYVEAQAQLQKSRVDQDVASKEYARLKSLYQENQNNISQKSLQSAQGTLLTSGADVEAGEQQLALQESAVRQAWGRVVANWVVDGSPSLQDILAQQKIFVQITVPPTLSIAPPETVSLEIPGTQRTDASFISSFPRTDPRIQGRSFLFIARAQEGLAPGANILAHFPVGKQIKGVILPLSAIVWSDGKAWVFLEPTPGHFVRRPATTDTVTEKGFLATEGFAPGERVVIQGAQDLLSEELQSHGQSGGESDED